MSLEQAMKQARASLQIEGFVVTKEHDRLVNSVLLGEISEEEFQHQVLLLLEKVNK